jgi:ribonuclease HI
MLDGVADTEDSGLLIAYTDGACSGNPGPGGWAWAIDGGASASGGEVHTTNQRMEMLAVLQALQTLLPLGNVRIVSDSTYVVNCFKQRWWANWERNGWKNSQKQPVANQDLWKPLIELVKPSIARIEFVWIKGHSGHPMNDLVDRLAVEAAKRIVVESESSDPVVALVEEPELPGQDSLF